MVDKFCWETPEHNKLTEEAAKFSAGTPHLRELLTDNKRTAALFVEAEGVCLDASRSLLDQEVLDNLMKVYSKMGVNTQLMDMYSGKHLNCTEDRAVGHVALRDGVDSFVVDGKDYIPEVKAVREKIYAFSENVRSGKFKGFSGKNLTDVVCIGIGGSYLGIEFVHEALRTNDCGVEAAKGRRIRFLANVDPIDVRRALEGLSPETTLAVVLSKTFTTAETMLNAKTVRDWFLNYYGPENKQCLANHLCAVSTNLKATSEFGIDNANVFGFWDWVGGRFSVCSAVGVLPLALQYGQKIVERFLDGCRSIDRHVLSHRENPHESIPAMMALISYYNASYLNYPCVAVLPYCQALNRFPAHIQQLTMESNGKRVTVTGEELPCSRFSGEIYFGEPGTNGQHSFYQLIHQGRVIPCEFIGFSESQNPVKIAESSISSHDELMCNFFAQPDALALGKTREQLQNEGMEASLIPHNVFPGNRPSMCLLFKGCLTPEAVGKLLAIYEHRVAIEGFLWKINSFDQYGVQLGKVLAKNVRGVMEKSRGAAALDLTGAGGLTGPTKKLLDKYFS